MQPLIFSSMDAFAIISLSQLGLYLVNTVLSNNAVKHL